MRRIGRFWIGKGESLIRNPCPRAQWLLAMTTVPTLASTMACIR